MTKIFVKYKFCDCKADFNKMTNTNLLVAHGFYMIYGCSHVLAQEAKEYATVTQDGSTK